MSIAALVRSLAAAGASPEAIAIAVEAVEGATAAEDAKREAARDRKRRQRDRERDSHAEVTAESQENPLPLSLPPQTPLTHTPTPVSVTTHAKGGSPQAEFAEWYDGYPHKIGRGDALKVFPKARSKATLAELIQGRDRYVATKPPDRPWCNPATWLNQERWLDQPAEPQTPTGSHERNRQPPNNRAAGRGVWSEIIAEHDGATARDLARA